MKFLALLVLAHAFFGTASSFLNLDPDFNLAQIAAVLSVGVLFVLLSAALWKFEEK